MAWNSDINPADYMAGLQAELARTSDKPTIAAINAEIAYTQAAIDAQNAPESVATLDLPPIPAAPAAGPAVPAPAVPAPAGS